MAGKKTSAKQQADDLTKYYHEAQDAGAHASELFARVSAAELLDPSDPGHVAAMNVALHKATDGRLGMSVDEAKEYTRNGGYLEREADGLPPIALSEIQDDLMARERAKMSKR